MSRDFVKQVNYLLLLELCLAFPKCRVEIQQVDANNSSEIEQNGKGVGHWTCQGIGLLVVVPYVSAQSLGINVCILICKGGTVGCVWTRDGGAQGGTLLSPLLSISAQV